MTENNKPTRRMSRRDSKAIADKIQHIQSMTSKLKVALARTRSPSSYGLSSPPQPSISEHGEDQHTSPPELVLDAPTNQSIRHLLPNQSAPSLGSVTPEPPVMESMSAQSSEITRAGQSDQSHTTGSVKGTSELTRRSLEEYYKMPFASNPSSVPPPQKSVSVPPSDSGITPVTLPALQQANESDSVEDSPRRWLSQAKMDAELGQSDYQSSDVKSEQGTTANITIIEQLENTNALSVGISELSTNDVKSEQPEDTTRSTATSVTSTVKTETSSVCFDNSEERIKQLNMELESYRQFQKEQQQSYKELQTKYLTDSAALLNQIEELGSENHQLKEKVQNQQRDLNEWERTKLEWDAQRQSEGAMMQTRISELSLDNDSLRQGLEQMKEELSLYQSEIKSQKENEQSFFIDRRDQLHRVSVWVRGVIDLLSTVRMHIGDQPVVDLNELLQNSPKMNGNNNNTGNNHGPFQMDWTIIHSQLSDLRQAIKEFLKGLVNRKVLLDESTAELEHENEGLVSEVSQQAHIIQELNEQLTEMDKRVEQMNEVQRQQIMDKENIKQALEERLIMKSEQMEQLNMIIDELKESCESQYRPELIHGDPESSIMLEKEDLADKLGYVRNEIFEQHVLKLESYLKEYSDLQIQANRLTQDNCQLKDQNKTLNSNMKRQRETYEREIRMLQETIETIERDSKYHDQTDNNNNTTRLNKMMITVSNLKKVVDSKEQEINSLRNELEIAHKQFFTLLEHASDKPVKSSSSSLGSSNRSSQVIMHSHRPEMSKRELRESGYTTTKDLRRKSDRSSSVGHLAQQKRKRLSSNYTRTTNQPHRAFFN